ncbi:MAG: pyridoxamine 5'-phosphate oxidase family protein [Caldiserica bacterium]|nr:pyridoxamine 5'-phosphate oxidase family protein [Caldisericota bacterium]
MNKSEIFSFLNANPMFHLATVEGNKPHVRAMLLYRADEDGIVFHTGTMKDVNRQLLANPEVELCFNNYQTNVQIRVSGTVKLLDDLNFKKEVVENRAFLKPWIEERGYGMLAVYRIKNGTATIWTMETNFAPKEFIKL